LRVEEKATHRRVSIAQEIVGLSANHAANDTRTIQNNPLGPLRSRNSFASFLKFYTNRRGEDQEVIVAAENRDRGSEGPDKSNSQLQLRC
jgi:hypothetical protein